MVLFLFLKIKKQGILDRMELQRVHKPCLINRNPLSLYPDYDRRLRNRTRSADLAKRNNVDTISIASARGLDILHAITAGGELRPALRT
jgi:hypothetical protein